MTKTNTNRVAEEQVELYNHYRQDNRFPNSDAVRRYIDDVPLTRKETAFYNRLLDAFEACEDDGE